MKNKLPSRDQRLQFIVELFEEKDPPTKQAEIKTRIEHKFQCSISEATVSRDLDLLKIEKFKNGYCLASEVTLSRLQERLSRTFKEFDVKVFKDAVVLAITTSPGSARTVAVKITDAYPKDVIGSVASDDVALIVTNSPDARKSLVSALTEVIKLSKNS